MKVNELIEFLNSPEFLDNQISLVFVNKDMMVHEVGLRLINIFEGTDGKPGVKFIHCEDKEVFDKVSHDLKIMYEEALNESR